MHDLDSLDRLSLYFLLLPLSRLDYMCFLDDLLELETTWFSKRKSFLALLDWILALHIVPQIRYLRFLHLREEESLDYDTGFVHLQIHVNFDISINRQQAPFSGAVVGEQAIKIQYSIAFCEYFQFFFWFSFASLKFDHPQKEKNSI
jgi:hypothetical protein